MIGRLAVACLLTTAPAFAQSPVYTNADLGKPRTWARTATAEQLASLVARQFVAPPVFPAGPTVMIVAGDPAHGPFGPLQLSPAQPLDPNWQNTGWYGSGFVGGGWYTGPQPFVRRDGRIGSGTGARSTFPSEHPPRIPPPGLSRRPPSPPSGGSRGAPAVLPRQRRGHRHPYRKTLRPPWPHAGSSSGRRSWDWWRPAPAD